MKQPNENDDNSEKSTGMSENTEEQKTNDFDATEPKEKEKKFSIAKEEKFFSSEKDGNDNFADDSSDENDIYGVYQQNKKNKIKKFLGKKTKNEHYKNKLQNKKIQIKSLFEETKLETEYCSKEIPQKIIKTHKKVKIFPQNKRKKKKIYTHNENQTNKENNLNLGKNQILDPPFRLITTDNESIMTNESEAPKISLFEENTQCETINDKNDDGKYNYSNIKMIKNYPGDVDSNEDNINFI